MDNLTGISTGKAGGIILIIIRITKGAKKPCVMIKASLSSEGSDDSARDAEVAGVEAGGGEAKAGEARCSDSDAAAVLSLFSLRTRKIYYLIRGE